jgi:GNAT superfamily N-acetyltransferase
MQIRLEPITTLDDEIDHLIAEANADGHFFVQRLRDAWASGENRFDRPGELLLAARIDGSLVGVGGLNVDPYAQTPGVARLRHLYVARRARRLGVGSALVQHIVTAARPHFAIVRLRTDSPDAAAFYLRLGFQPTDQTDATHILRFG